MNAIQRLFSSRRPSSSTTFDFVVWMVPLALSCVLIELGAMSTCLGVRGRTNAIRLPVSICSAVAGVVLLGAITRWFPWPIRVMFLAVWAAFGVAVGVLA